MRSAAVVACAAALLVGASSAASAGERAAPKSELVFFGTRDGGPGTGISAARLDPATGALVSLGLAAAADKPTWLLASRRQPVVYAVREVGNDGGTEAGVSGFAVDRAGGRLTKTSAVASGGGGATFLIETGDRSSPALLVANYGTGDVAVLPIRPDGTLGAATSSRRDVGSGPTARQASAHPHGIAADPTGRYALVADLGADRIFVYRYDAAGRSLTPASPSAVAVPPGSGPRHVVFHPGGHYVYANAELTGDILAFRWDAVRGMLIPIGTIATRGDYVGDISSGEIVPSRNGRFLYVSNRGEDALLVFAVNQETGGLSLLQRIPSGGKDPGSFAFDPTGRWLIVANAGSDTATVFGLDPASGRLTSTGGAMAVHNPTSIAFPTR